MYDRWIVVFAIDELDVSFWGEAIQFEFGKVAALEIFFDKKLRHDGNKGWLLQLTKQKFM